MKCSRWAKCLAESSLSRRNVTGAWIKDQEVVVKNGTTTEYRVRIKISPVVKD
jgi:hypothetical protein